MSQVLSFPSGKREGEGLQVAAAVWDCQCRNCTKMRAQMTEAGVGTSLDNIICLLSEAVNDPEHRGQP